MKGHFRGLSLINTTPVTVVLSIDIPIQMEPSVITEKCELWVKNQVIYCPQKPFTKNAFSYNLFQILEPVLFYTSFISTVFFVVYFLYKTNPVECTFFTILETVDECGT
jgi:hypothetical protein